MNKQEQFPLNAKIQVTINRGSGHLTRERATVVGPNTITHLAVVWQGDNGIAPEMVPIKSNNVWVERV